MLRANSSPGAVARSPASGRHRPPALRQDRSAPSAS